MLVVALGKKHGLSADREHEFSQLLLETPRFSGRDPRARSDRAGARGKVCDETSCAFLRVEARSRAIAMEGALKLKEISYIHAEAYAAGELKHGPLALIDSDMPVVAVAPNNDLLEKLKSNLQEVRARGGELYRLRRSRRRSLARRRRARDHRCPSTLPNFRRLSSIRFRCNYLAYHVATMRGTDVDQPRNLAKSVTVE
jgi:glucosamine--fructose-6-phosphate aminotransferase (isomerizing)